MHHLGLNGNILGRCLTQLMMLFLVLFVQNLAAEQKEVFDGPDGSEYEVHYIAFSSTMLDPEVARQYDLMRSRALGLLNISVIKVEEDGSRSAVGASVEAKMTNDIQQHQFLSFRQVVEGSAIYYLSQLQHREGEPLKFTVTVYPEGSRKPLSFQFSQHFYSEDR